MLVISSLFHSRIAGCVPNSDWNEVTVTDKHGKQYKAFLFGPLPEQLQSKFKGNDKPKETESQHPVFARRLSPLKLYFLVLVLLGSVITMAIFVARQRPLSEITAHVKLDSESRVLAIDGPLSSMDVDRIRAMRGSLRLTFAGNTRIDADFLAQLNRILLVQVISLDFSGALFDDNSLRALVNQGPVFSHVQELVLASTQITDSGMEDLSRSYPNFPPINRLDLTNTNVTATAVLKLRKNLALASRLEQLRVPAQSSNDHLVVSLLADNSDWLSLSELYLPGAKLGGRGIEAIARHSTRPVRLKQLILRNSSLDDRQLTQLANSPNLSSLQLLDIFNTDVTDVGVTALTNSHSKLVNLRTLFLPGGAISTTSINALCRQDSALRNLTYLSLSGSSITDDSLECMADSDCFLSMQSLDLNDCNAITSSGLLRLLAGTSKMENLKLLSLKNISLTDNELAQVKLSKAHLTVLH